MHTTIRNAACLACLMTALLSPAGCGSDEEDGPGPVEDAPPLGGGAAPSHDPPVTTPTPERLGVPPTQGARRTAVPDELVGAWQSGYVDFELWETYKQGQWAGRNAIPSREAMIFRKNGDAKFYRYEFLFTLYEELIDCEGTVTFNGDGTFTFYPVKGRKRFIDMNNSIRTVDRALTAEELAGPKLAGTRAYELVPSDPDAIRIKVPSSAPYNWYRKKD